MLRFTLSLLPKSPTSLRAAAWLVAGIGLVDMTSVLPMQPLGAQIVEVATRARSAPAPLAEGDSDHDGLSDAAEAAWAERYAPVVILDKDDWNRPASIPWLLSRSDMLGDGTSHVAVAGLAGAGPLPSGKVTPLDRATRHGSDDPKDWTTYVHVYPRTDGGVNIQYWFFYPYNDGPIFFDHESDWEHLTVRLDAKGEPLGVDLARHEHNDPGLYRSWDNTRKEGDHPVVLSARGSHATYADPADVPWFEYAGACGDLQACEHPVWRTWQGGGLEDLADRGTEDPVQRAVAFDGRWGMTGLIPGTSAPRGPRYNPGFCVAGYASCGARAKHGAEDRRASR